MWLYAHVKASGIYTKLIFCRLLVPLHCSQICVPDYLSLCVCTCQTVCVQAASISIIHVYSQCLLNHSTTKSIALLIMMMYLQVYKLLRTQGHNVVAVFTVPDVAGRPDPLAEVAEKDGVKVFKFPRWRNKGAAIASVNIDPWC